MSLLQCIIKWKLTVRDDVMQGDGGVGMEVKIFIKKYKQTQTKTGVVQLAVKKYRKTILEFNNKTATGAKSY